MNARIKNVWWIVLCCAVIAACGGGGGGGGGSGPQTQTIQFATPGTLTGAVGTTVTNLASGGGGTGAITYSSSAPSVAAVDASTGTATVLTVGSTTITATKAASPGFTAASATYALNGTPGSQAIQFEVAGPITGTVGSSVMNAASGGAGNGTITYQSSNPAVATVNASSGVVSLASAGTALINATKAADANYSAAQASYSINVQAGTSASMTAWISSSGTRVNLPAATIGKELVTARMADCTAGQLVTQCAGRQRFPIAGTTIEDPRATLTNAAHYAVVDGPKVGATVDVNTSRFSPRIGHAVAHFRNRYWVVGGGEPVIPGTNVHTAKADVWSSADGRSWKLETSDGGFGARWFHQMVAFNDRLWIISGAPIPITNPSAPWYADVWSSADGVTWTQASTNAGFPWWSPDLNVIVFNNEMLAVSGGRVYASTNGTFTPKVTGDPVLLTTSLGRASATLTIYNGELYYIAGKVDYPINTPQTGEMTNDVWKSPNGTTWTQVTANAPFPARYRHSAFVADGKLWVMGGVTSEGPVVQARDAWSTTNGLNWTQEAVDGIARGYLMAVVQEPTKATLIGGVQYAYSNHVWQSSNGANWTDQSAFAQFSPRHTRAVSFNGELWIVAGQATSGRLADSDTNEIWRSSDGLSWTRVTPTGAVFEPRNGNSLTVFNGRLWVIGGWTNPTGNNQVRMNDIWSSADGVTWHEDVASAPFSARVGHGAIAHAGSLWILGGSTSIGLANDVWTSPDGIAWTQVPTVGTPFGARVAHVESFNGEMWIVGGSGASGALGDIWRSSNGASWTSVTASTPHFGSRTRHELAIFNGRMYLIAGTTSESYANGQLFNDVWSTADGITWRLDAEHAPFSPRTLFGLTVHANELWLIGGLGVALNNDVWRSADGINWRVGFSHSITAP